MTPQILLTDMDADTLDAREVFGFGGKTLNIGVTQDGDRNAVVLNVGQVEKLINFLQDFVK